jgi:Cu/Ag efflux protein CusF
MKNNSAGAILLCLTLLAATASALEYSREATLILPKDYRQWVFLTSSIGMSYDASAGPMTNPNFENVFVNPVAYQAFLMTGTWPDKTVLILEGRGSDTRVSINKNGRVQTNVVAIAAHVKDSSHGGWAFYDFGNGMQPEGTLLPKSADCYSCHEQNGAVDTTFVQFYPTLAEIAKAKGTFTEASAEKKSAEVEPRRFELTGIVQSVDAEQRMLIVKHDEIPGFMAAMTMPYKVGRQEDLTNLSPGDQIHAVVVVNADEMHLENITVTGHPKTTDVH